MSNIVKNKQKCVVHGSFWRFSLENIKGIVYNEYKACALAAEAFQSGALSAVNRDRQYLHRHSYHRNCPDGTETNTDRITTANKRKGDV